MALSPDHRRVEKAPAAGRSVVGAQDFEGSGAHAVADAPMRRGCAQDTVWRKFIALHMNMLVACDFFTKAIVTPLGTRMTFCLFFIHLETRRVFVCPATYEPDERWMKQQERNALMWMEESGIKAAYLLHDRDSKFCRGFRELLRSAGIRSVRTPKLAPNANAFAESWVGSVKRECLDHFVCFSRGHLDHILSVFARFHNQFRPHQGRGNLTLSAAAAGTPIATNSEPLADDACIRCTHFLGGLLRHYYRDAA